MTMNTLLAQPRCVGVGGLAAEYPTDSTGRPPSPPHLSTGMPHFRFLWNIFVEYVCGMCLWNMFVNRVLANMVGAVMNITSFALACTVCKSAETNLDGWCLEKYNSFQGSNQLVNFIYFLLHLLLLMTTLHACGTSVAQRHWLQKQGHPC
jgi:hypothetical protein